MANLKIISTNSIFFVRNVLSNLLRIPEKSLDKGISMGM